MSGAKSQPAPQGSPRWQRGLHDDAAGWRGSNQRHLAAALDLIRRRFDAHSGQPAGLDVGERALTDASTAIDGASALDALRVTFGLSLFETEIVALCAGVELDADLAMRCATAPGGTGQAFPSFGLALSMLPGAHWSALTPGRPLRYHGLVELQPGGTLATSALRIDERVLHYLTGLRCVDARLEGLIETVDAPGELAPSHEALVDIVVDAWTSASRRPIIELHGPDPDARRAIAAAAAERLELGLFVVTAEALGREQDERQLARLLTREAALDGAAVLLDVHAAEAGDAHAVARLRRLADRVDAPTLLSARDRGPRLRRPSLPVEVGRPTLGEQRMLFRAAIADDRNAVDAATAHAVDQVAAQFDLGATAIHMACTHAQRSTGRDGDPIGPALWDACRRHSRTDLEELAQRIVADVGWGDLVLPEPQRKALHEIVIRVRQRSCVYDSWGFAARGSRGLGISALFSGPSGTGKTLAAEVLAHELRLDLYRIDLSQVVSKYIGETERNLRRVFDAAEEGAAVLLFDEADALFGKRSEVKDSHDRYANIEVGYLLQRMESYRGLAILTTNFRSALDQAFLRRLAFVVEFPMPDPAMRAEIWRRAFPAATPTDSLDIDQLARLNLSGGNIRNVALGAAFLAADAGEPVRTTHVLAAARGEFSKLERPMPVELVGRRAP